mmetsp:Transcript_85504/g.170713  ORF Transcript_85504/g.170713 Transcript_85504/m.170713 type:complete len:387 (+) Transcript_85504:322-1482(+)
MSWRLALSAAAPSALSRNDSICEAAASPPCAASTAASVSCERACSASASYSALRRTFSRNCATEGASEPSPKRSPQPRAASAASSALATSSRSFNAPASSAASWPTTTAASLRTTAILLPNSMEHIVSPVCSASVAAAMTTAVHELPPIAPRSMLVSVESRYGTCAARSPTALTTLPSVVSDELMPTAWRMPTPSTPVLEIRSDPARSTQTSSLCVTVPRCRSVTCKCTKQCERDERALRRWPIATRVSSTVLASLATSAAVLSSTRVSPTVPTSPLPPPPPPLPPLPPPPPEDDRGARGGGAPLLCSASRLASRSASSSFCACQHLPHRQAGGWTPWKAAFEPIAPAVAAPLPLLVRHVLPPTLRPAFLAPTERGWRRQDSSSGH